MSLVRADDRAVFEVGAARFEPVTDPGRGGGELAVWQVTVADGPAGQPHVIDREEVFLCTAGTFELVVDGVSHRLNPGDAVSARAGSTLAAGATGGPASATVCCRLGLTATLADGTVLSPPWAQPA